MHGDAATDHALEFALRGRKAFAIVPCCVFGNLAPWRPHVRTYTDLLSFLEDRARRAGANVQRMELPFDGKNVLLYALHYCDENSNCGPDERRN